MYRDFRPEKWWVLKVLGFDSSDRSRHRSAWFGPIERDGKSIIRYLGHYVYGRRVIMHYEIGTRLAENISRMKNGCFVRMVSAFQKGVTVFPFKLGGYNDWEIKTNGKVIVAWKIDAKSPLGHANAHKFIIGMVS